MKFKANFKLQEVLLVTDIKHLKANRFGRPVFDSVIFLAKTLDYCRCSCKYAKHKNLQRPLVNIPPI